MSEKWSEKEQGGEVLPSWGGRNFRPYWNWWGMPPFIGFPAPATPTVATQPKKDVPSERLETTSRKAT